MLRWLFVFFIGFTGGVALRSFLDFGIAFSFFILLLGLIILAWQCWGVQLRNIGLISVFIIAVSLGMLRFDISDLNNGTLELDLRVGQEVILEGIVVDEPDVRETHTKLKFKVSAYTEDSSDRRRTKFETNSTKILVIVEHHPEFLYGDKVILKGKLGKPKNFIQSDDEPGRPFDYISYLAKDGIFYQMFYPEIELVAHGQGNKIKEMIFSFKQKLLENVTRVVPEPHASLAGGITLGTKQSLGEELLDDFRKTGVIHIVVLSGYNISIVAVAVARAATFAPKFLGATLSVFTILAFAIMTGSGATVVRASIMALLVLLARTTGRIY